jgi:hypothetical protein
LGFPLTIFFEDGEFKEKWCPNSHCLIIWKFQQTNCGRKEGKPKFPFIFQKWPFQKTKGDPGKGGIVGTWVGNLEGNGGSEV